MAGPDRALIKASKIMECLCVAFLYQWFLYQISRCATTISETFTIYDPWSTRSHDLCIQKTLLQGLKMSKHYQLDLHPF